MRRPSRAALIALAIIAFHAAACDDPSPTGPVPALRLPGAPRTPSLPGAAPIPPPEGWVRFVSSDPPPGSEIHVRLGPWPQAPHADAFSMTFDVNHAALALADDDWALLEVDLLDSAGNVCASASVLVYPVSKPWERVELSDFAFIKPGCPFPGQVPSLTTVSLRASISGQSRCPPEEYPLSYSLVADSLSDVPTSPEILELCWDALGVPTGWCSERPLEGELATYWCTVDDPDGDALTITLTFTTRSGCNTPERCWSEKKHFDPRATPMTVRLHSGNYVMPEGTGKEITCRVTDSRGLRDEWTACLDHDGYTPHGSCP